ncbi:uncharacterized protein [Misgurnus anguillicaudatus]|uniref:uncharacterized protein n=1 Tax=Misgurnus anguillicaudatus TaxID=75329 RepID=UPI002435FF76|nr:uncharacterized protein LOC129431910 [Misgurnus anguillicaudatus]
MSSVVSYSLLLVICFSSYSLQDPHLKGTMVEGHLGGNVSIQCATEDKNQDGVYMYRHKPGEPKPQRIFYFYHDGTYTLNEDANVKIIRSGTFPGFTITFSNLTLTDSAQYWCEFNLEEKITFSMITWLSVTDPAPVPSKVQNQQECPDNNVILYVTIGCTVFSIIFLLCIIGVIVKVKNSRKYEPAKSSESSVYEEMTRTKLDSMSTLINPAYQSSRQVR